MDFRVYRRLLGVSRPYAGRLAMGVVAGLVYAGANGAFLYAVNKGLGKVYDEATVPLWRIGLVAALIPCVGFLRSLSDYASKYWIRWVGCRVVMDLRNAVVSRLNQLSLSYFAASRTGEIISRITNDTVMAENAVSSVVEDLAKEPVTLLVMVGILFWLDPWLALASLVLFPVCIVPVALFGRRVRRFTREAQERIADLVSSLQEMITGVRVVKAFGMEQYEEQRFQEQNRAFFGRVMRVARANSAVEPLIMLISTVGIAIVLLYVRWRAMPFNQFVTYAGALVMMYTPVKKLSRIHLQIQQAVGAAERIFDVLDRPVEVRDRPGAAMFDGRVRYVEFDEVSFSYETDRVLDGVSFRVLAGQRLAIVGASGAGKTTLVNLLPRFYDVTGGAIRINGVDIRDFSLRSLRSAMGIVTQETVLFNDTVANNIRYGSAGASPEAVEQAARRANAHDFICELPRGYETVIGEHGVRLSGGQRQRLAIARAILRNPPILILDEATSALDTESERLVQAALGELMTGRTVFAIAHRLSTIAHCEQIIVLDGGRITERGAHAELMALGGLYKRLHDMQFRDADTAPLKAV